MQKLDVTTKNINESSVELTIKVPQEMLDEVKAKVLKQIQPEVEADGFRKGKVPLNVVEKTIKPDFLQSQFLDEILMSSYASAIDEKKLRVIKQPDVNITAFVPYSQLEYTATVTVMPPVKLGDYKKIKKTAKAEKLDGDEIDKVIDNLRTRVAEAKPVDRGAKEEDQVIIDFDGSDADKKPVAGAKGDDYPLVIGSKKFIPGFEEEVVGLKKGDEKTFDITFPEDYGHKPLAGAVVTFKVSVKEVKELVKPEANDEFAAKVGPFKNIDELKADIEGQLKQEKQTEAQSKLRDEIIEELVKQSEVTVPDELVDDQLKHVKEDFVKNLTYRGVTFAEFLEQQGVTEEEYEKTELRPKAEQRVKVSIVLSEVAEEEEIRISQEELDIRIQLLKGQSQSQAQEFDRPEVRRNVANRLMTEKTMDKLEGYAKG